MKHSCSFTRTLACWTLSHIAFLIEFFSPAVTRNQEAVVGLKPGAIEMAKL
jgi:hypothetical protein